MNLFRRIGKLEAGRFDDTGLVPRSEAWFAHFEGQFDRLMAGENVPYIPLAVIDRIVEAADREEQARAR